MLVEAARSKEDLLVCSTVHSLAALARRFGGPWCVLRGLPTRPAFSAEAFASAV
jgi:hypothetical protein